ncbi:MAG: DUF6475 domain-containing protein [Ghiorsea sp.]
MTNEDFNEFCACWSQACIGVGKDATPQAIEWAFEVLRDKGIAEIRTALIHHARDPKSGQFQPKPADIIRHIDGTRDDRKELAVLAFARVLDNLNSYSTVVFDDPAIHFAIAVAFGGWIEAGLFDASKFECQEQRRAFVTAYTSFKQGTAYLPRLTGIHKQGEASTGYASQASITYIGDKQKALAVENNGRVGGMLKNEAAPKLRAIA